MANGVQMLKALSDETRLRILHLLCQGELCVCRIEEILGVGQSRASRHLAHLRNAELVRDRREGQWVYYSLAQPQGLLQRRLWEWLKDAGDEVPRGKSDLMALREVRECSDLYSDQDSDQGIKTCEHAAAGGS